MTAARVLVMLVSGLLALGSIAVIEAMWTTAMGRPGAIGFDLTIYVDRTASFLEGTGFYRDRQLSGEAYRVIDGDAMYPPIVMLLVLPWTFGAPAVLWWAIPLGIIALALRAMRPPVWALPILLAVLAYPRTQVALICGNPSMWAFAFLAAGLVWRWPAALVPFKLTLAPFALVGMRDRGWWRVCVVGLLVCIPFGATVWAQWATATLTARGSLDYALGEWPIGLAFLAVAWLSRRRGGHVGRPSAGRGSSRWWSVRPQGLPSDASEVDGTRGRAGPKTSSGR